VTPTQPGPAIPKVSLGDGVYVVWDGTAIKLTTEQGSRVTNEIYLEPNVFNNLVQYVERHVEGQK
jgi:hypothetical protein